MEGARGHGTAPVSWVTGKPPFLGVREGFTGTNLQLVPLADGSGYVGMCSLNTGQGKIVTGSYGAGNNATFRLVLDMTAAAQNQVPSNDRPSFYIWFGGFTITRL